MNYYYNENTKMLTVTTNFEYNHAPKGFVEITKEEYDRLQEELNAQNENVENNANTNNTMVHTANFK